MKTYIFDVDGTLTPSRGQMPEKFRNWFEHFATHAAVYFVTGSDREKTIEQLGYIYNLAVRVYQCNGNDVWEQGNNIRTNRLTLPSTMERHLDRILNRSQFPIKTGNHIEYRPGLVNFSIVGRNCDKRQRAEYVEWDTANNERDQIALELRRNYPNLDVTVAGETGIDITKRNSGKEQIVKDFDIRDNIYFFGDKIQPGGNDYTLAVALANLGHNVYPVNNWTETMNLLRYGKK